jgi:hypothetical protein
MDKRIEKVGRNVGMYLPYFRSSLRSFSVMGLFKGHLSCGRRQTIEVRQIVGGADQMGVVLHTSNAAHAAQATVGFHPPEDLLDPPALLLADRVAGMPCGARIESGRAPPVQSPLL